LFRIASAGKSITAVAVLTLAADGLLRLDEPIGDFLPELSSPRVLRQLSGPLDDTVPAVDRSPCKICWSQQTVTASRRTSRCPVVTRLLAELHQGPPQPQVVAPPDEWMVILGSIPLLHQPGEGFTYNTSFDILSVLVARVSGKPFVE
jgi:CubicO group peptidase (beta-lactamase class C family)